MIDTHCHLTDPRLLNQLDDVLYRAGDAGVSQMITVGTNLEDDRAAIELCRRFDNMRCAIGIHPNYSQDARVEDVAALRALAADPMVLALGEMGLDYFHHFADRKHQAVIFEAQLALAAEMKKPVVIHSREAIVDTLAMMRAFPTVKGVFHCFTGTMDEAKKIIDAGHLISFTGPITYKKNDALRDVVRMVPVERLMVETDAPYLSPEPRRGQKTNEPGLVMYTAQKVAEIKGVAMEELDRIMTGTARGLFGWGG